MDDSRFDSFTQLIASGRSRRDVMKALIGGVFGGALGLAGQRGAIEAKPKCREEGHPCEGNQTCCDGLVCAAGDRGKANRCRRCPDGQIACGGRCIDTCAASDVCHLAGVCDPGTGRCTNPPAPAGTPCTTGDLCGGSGTCDGSGACIPGAPVQCDPCQTCDPVDGRCQADAGQEGADCPGDDRCFERHVCDNGRCVGVDSVVCAAPDECHGPGTCVPATGSCSYPDLEDGTACGDGDACLEGARCLGGVCQGGEPVVCTTDNPCLTARCDRDEGCVFAPKPAGAACGDGNACNGNEACDGEGRCQSGEAITCDPCLRCNREDGICEPDSDQDGRACPGDGDLCFGRFECAAGECVGAGAIECTALDDCHLAGICDPGSGQCSNPNAPDGSDCSAGPNRPGTCEAGVCTGGATSDGVCLAAGDGCGSSASICDDGSQGPCFCFTTTEDTVRCASPADIGLCSETCTSSADCPGMARSDGGTFGPGAFCARVDGCCDEGVSVCFEPCPSYCTIECACPQACVGDLCIGPGPVETGALAIGGSTFARCGTLGTGYLYQTHDYTHTGGVLTIGTRGSASGGGTIGDTFLALYTDFDPDDPCSGLVATNDDNGCTLESRIAGSFPAGLYTVVVTTFGTNVEGTYSLEFNRCSPCGH